MTEEQDSERCGWDAPHEPHEHGFMWVRVHCPGVPEDTEYRLYHHGIKAWSREGVIPVSKLIINFEAEPDLSLPWPVGVTNGTVTSGLGEDDRSNLIGFGELGEQSITVFPEDVINDPSRAVGLVPTFAGPRGGLFEWGHKVSRVEVIDASDVVA